MREADETTVVSAEAADDQQDEEVNWDITNDEFKDYFSKSYEPKVLITSGDNPHSVSELNFKILALASVLISFFSVRSDL